MSTQSVTVKEDITSFTVVGGTDLVLTPGGERITNGVRLIAAAVTDFYSRLTMVLRSRDAKVNLSTGVVTKAKQWYNISQPRLDADGGLYYDVVRIEVETHPYTSAADKASLINLAAHTLVTNDLSAFRASESLG